MELEKTVERIIPKNFKNREEYLLYLRHLFAYEALRSKLDQSDDLLEIGFGEGYGARLVSDHVHSLVGVDVNEEAVEYANEQYGSPSTSFQTYDGDSFPFDNHSFDCVISCQVIEHVEEDEAFLRELYRVLKWGGTAFLTTPNRLHRLKRGQKPWNPFHVREYSPDQFEHLLQGVFEEVEIYGVNAEPEVRQIEVDRVRRGVTLKKLLPDTLKRIIYGNFIEKYDTGSFFLDGENISLGLDLFAVGLKKEG